LAKQSIFPFKKRLYLSEIQSRQRQHTFVYAFGVLSMALRRISTMFPLRRNRLSFVCCAIELSLSRVTTPQKSSDISELQ
jgi:hypothetical protein